MTENDSGEGRLVGVGNDSRAYTVDYVLEVVPKVTGQSARFSPPKMEVGYSLQVEPRNNETIPDGEYTLETSKEILRVCKSGPRWQVV